MIARSESRVSDLSAVALALLLGVAGSQDVSAQPAQPAPPERLSWQGDPNAPPLSGVWVRTDPPADVGASKSKEGWTPWPAPLKPKFAAVWRKRVADAVAGKRADDPVQGCLPPGMPRYVTGTLGSLLIIQTPGRVTMYRDGDPVRRIWLDGRSLPKAADLESFSNGTAIGHYAGPDLVTEVAGFKDYPIDGTGVPHSDDLRITERYHRLDAKTLQVEVTLTDPTAYIRPMKTTVTYKASDNPLWEPKEFICKPQTNYHPDVYIH